MNAYEALQQAKAQRPDLLLTPQEAQELLKANGWSLHAKQWREDITQTWVKHYGDRDHLILLPMRPDFDDYPQRMHEVMVDLASDMGLSKNEALRAVVLGLVR